LKFRFHVFLIVAAFAGSLPAITLPAQQQTEEIQTILERAAEYVSVYEDRQLGNVLAEEKYFQRIGNSASNQRRTDSDFLIILVGTERMGIRKVNRVDGRAVKSTEPNLQALMDDSPEGIQKRIRILKDESSQYNIGPIQRNINLPTFALQVVRRDQASRFSFVKRGTDKIHGIEGVELKFQEQRGPTLVHGVKGESLLSSGAVWIEPATGRVLKTEFTVENPYSDPKAQGRVTVSYAISKSLGILVPDEMTEHYEAARFFVDCTADYSNFRSFNVDVKSEIAAPAKQ